MLAQAAHIGTDRLWIEKVRLETTPHELAGDVAARGDAVADLQGILLRAETDTAFLQSLQDELMQLVGMLPLEVIAVVPELELIRQGRTGELVRRITPALVAHVDKAG